MRFIIETVRAAARAWFILFVVWLLPLLLLVALARVVL